LSLGMYEVLVRVSAASTPSRQTMVVMVLS
jgi:hypothetical protein